MKKEPIFYLVIGVIIGALFMILWQFNSRLNNVALGVNQLNQATSQNSQTIDEVVNFINSGPDQTTTPAQ